MCGIAGYVGSRSAVPVVMDQIKRLEYRGYDSAGVAAVNGSIQIIKTVGKLSALEELLGGQLQEPQLAVAHTRWATHGKPSTPNSHPHPDCSGDFVVCHNGIIENYIELREWLKERGHQFQSETDTEVLPHLIEELYDGDLEAALRQALTRVRGSYGLVVVSARHPGLLLAARRDSPLVIGLGEGEYFVASDIPAVLPYTRDVVVLEDGDFAVIRKEGAQLTALDGSPVERPPLRVTWDATSAEKGGYDHFMLKEIHEQPASVRDTLRGRIVDGRVDLSDLGLTEERVKALDRVYLVACGTAYHAGLVAAGTWEKRLRVPVLADVASEFRYREPVLDDRTLVVLISQSGETADTLAAMREAHAHGAATVAIVNVVGSTLAREAGAALYTQAGPEICVASTKAYTSQLTAIYLLGLYLGRLRGTLAPEEEARVVAALQELPGQVERILEQEPQIAELASSFADCHDFFFLGRGLDYAVAQEGALKLKEISYRHSEALAAGEMKHGTLALVTSEVSAICISTQEHLREKLASNLKEVKAREGYVLAIARESDDEISHSSDVTLRIPDTLDELMPVLAIVPLQLLAYFIARNAGCEIDQPRNLAKSVTVE
ncbi:MAG: glutamine--fructose-6-phosphate transaminase (isomerizing) [Armatimonadota bacterium]